MNARNKTLDDTRAFAAAVANKQGWELNPDQGFTTTVLEGLTKNHQRHGYFLCPCRDGDGDKAKDQDIICPCHYAAADIKEYGHCYCALFMSPKMARELPQGTHPGSIPERRPEEKYL